VEEALRSWFDTDAGTLCTRAQGFDAGDTSLCTLTATLKHKLPWRKEPYRLTLYLPRAVAATAGPLGKVDFKCVGVSKPVPKPKKIGFRIPRKRHQLPTATTAHALPLRRTGVVRALATMGAELGAGAHKLQQRFRVPVFVVLAPFSFSGRVLDTTEATALLSTASIALSNCGVRPDLPPPLRLSSSAGRRTHHLGESARQGARTCRCLFQSTIPNATLT
jgi:hypothetical protein